MACMCGDSECRSCGTAQGTRSPKAPKVPVKFQARCTCGWTSGWLASYKAAQSWRKSHRQDTEDKWQMFREDRDRAGAHTISVERGNG